MNDLRYAVRMLLKSPVFAMVTVLSLALGIGAGTAIFSLVNGILLSSLPVPNPQELRVVNWSGADANMSYDGFRETESPGRQNGQPPFPAEVFLALREQCAAQADIFGYSPLDDVTARARHEASSATGLMVSDNFFSGLGVRPLLAVCSALRINAPEPRRPPSSLIGGGNSSLISIPARLTSRWRSTDKASPSWACCRASSPECARGFPSQSFTYRCRTRTQVDGRCQSWRG